MKTDKQKPSNNVFHAMIRNIVREELVVTEERIINKLDYRMDQKFVEFEEKIEEKLSAFRSEIMNGIDKITGMFKKHEDEHEILNSQQKRLITVEEKVASLEKIHPQGHQLAV